MAKIKVTTLNIGNVMEEQELRDLVPPPAVIAFLEDDCMHEITIRASGTGMVPITYQKIDEKFCKIGDIVEINQISHAWYGCLLVVDETKSWGIKAHAVIPQRNDTPQSCSKAHNRLKFEEFRKVGSIK